VDWIQLAHGKIQRYADLITVIVRVEHSDNLIGFLSIRSSELVD
jgi:hypothetical protein